MPRNLHSPVHEVTLLVDCTGNGLKDAIWRGDRRLSEMGLTMPFKENDIESSEMGLNMPSIEHDGESSEMGLEMSSKVDAYFIRISLWGFLFLLFEEESIGECFRGIEPRNFSFPLLY